MAEEDTRWGPKTTCDELLAGRSLAGQVILITGANAGIGFETAQVLAGHGARLYLACRSEERASEAQRRIRQHHPDADVRTLCADLASFDSVRQGVASFPEPALNTLICNAGLYQGSYTETADGLEETVGVCHFGHFLLIHLLLPRLEAAVRPGAGARVVMVSSESHRHPSNLDFDHLPLSGADYTALVAYGQAKLCNVLCANELSRRYADRGITANALHPGALIPTSIGKHSLFLRLLVNLARPFSKSLSQGAATTVYCATAPELEGVGGRYYSDCQERRPSREAQNAEVANRLWELSLEQVGLQREPSPTRALL